MTLKAPAFTPSEDFYQFHWPDLGIEITLERFNETNDDIRCEATVTVDHQLYGGRLYSGRLLLIGPNSRRDVRRSLEDRTRDPGGEPAFDWQAILEQVCMMARERFRTGTPIVDLFDVNFTDRPKFLLAPFIVHNGITVPYGDGKTAKSLFVLRLCVLLALQGVRSLYLDWEDDAETHAERLRAICEGMNVAPEDIAGMIFYQPRSVKLSDAVREIRKAIAEHQIEHVVVDSLGMAAGDPNDHGLAVEAMRSARSLGVACTCIHHLPKDAKDKTKPFGSVYSSNEARMTWLFEKAQDEGKDELALLLTNHAFNRGRLQPKEAWKLRFINDGDTLASVEFDTVPVGQVKAFRPKTANQRLAIRDALLANGAMTPPDIQKVLEADDIEISANAIGTILRRNPSLFVRREGGSWGVIVTESQTV